MILFGVHAAPFPGNEKSSHETMGHSKSGWDADETTENSGHTWRNDLSFMK
jgi:hypothetical protein